jgi:hypothetical protein
MAHEHAMLSVFRSRFNVKGNLLLARREKPEKWDTARTTATFARVLVSHAL